MDIQLYTQREITALKSGEHDTSFIDKIKVRVAQRTENVEEWSYRYMSATRILKALVKAGELESKNSERTWFIPRSPSRLFTKDGDDIDATTVKYNDDRDLSCEVLDAVYNRPRRELLDYLTILGAGSNNPEGELSYLRYDVGPDMNQRYIKLTWSIKSKPNVTNVIYLHRGSKEKKK